MLSPVRRAGVVGALAVSLVMAGCTGGDAPTSDDTAAGATPSTTTQPVAPTSGESPGPTGTPAPTDQPTPTPTPTPTPPARTMTLTEPVKLDFACGCVAQALGVDGRGRVAMVHDHWSPTGTNTDPGVTVFKPSGDRLWKTTFATGTVSSDPLDTPALGMAGSIVVQTEGALKGLSWQDGSQLWTIDNVTVRPRRLSGRDDVFVLAGLLFGDPLVHHPKVTIVDAATGESRWSGRDLAGWTADDTTGHLVAARASRAGAKLIRVNPDNGNRVVVDVPGWKGRLRDLRADAGRVSAWIGPEGDNDKRAVDVDWKAGTVSPRKRADIRLGSQVPRGHELVSASDDGSLVLAARVRNGTPRQAVMLDADGQMLWEAPAGDVLSWSGKGDGLFVEDATVHGSADGPGMAVVVVDRTPGYEPPAKGAIANKQAKMLTVLDAMTGEHMWAWGSRDTVVRSAIRPAEGIALLAAGGTTSISNPKPTKVTISAVDLVTGEPDFRVERGRAAWVVLKDLDSGLVVSAGDRWFLTRPTKR